MDPGFLSVAEHQLRTPLTVTLGWLDVLEKGWDRMSDDDRRRGLAIARRYTERLQVQIDRTMEAFRAATESGTATPLDVPLRAVTATAIRVVADEGHHEPVALDGEDVVVSAGEDQLLTVLIQVIRNAHQHGAPPFTATTARDGERGLIAVRDAGPGPGDVAVFEAFTSGDGERARPGLGLWIARALVAGMGGTIDLVADGEGTTVTVSLPLT